MALTIDFTDLDPTKGIAEMKATVRNGMRRAGEIFTASARERGSYKDQTGNLRNSNGFGIAENGSFAEVHGNDAWVKGVKDEDITGDMVLEAGAGEFYASYVQRKGYDVTDSGQLAAENELRRLFK